MAGKKGEVQFGRGGVMGGLEASESKAKHGKVVRKERESGENSENEEGNFASQLTVDLTEIDRLLRLKEVLQYIPVSKSTWWAGVKSGRYPAPVKLGPRTTTWALSSILQLMNQKEGNSYE